MSLKPAPKIGRHAGLVIAGAVLCAAVVVAFIVPRLLVWWLERTAAEYGACCSTFELRFRPRGWELRGKMSLPSYGVEELECAIKGSWNDLVNRQAKEVTAQATLTLQTELQQQQTEDKSDLALVLSSLASAGPFIGQLLEKRLVEQIGPVQVTIYPPWQLQGGPLRLKLNGSWEKGPNPSIQISCTEDRLSVDLNAGVVVSNRVFGDATLYWAIQPGMLKSWGSRAGFNLQHLQVSPVKLQLHSLWPVREGHFSPLFSAELAPLDAYFLSGQLAGFLRVGGNVSVTLGEPAVFAGDLRVEGAVGGIFLQGTNEVSGECLISRTEKRISHLSSCADLELCLGSSLRSCGTVEVNLDHAPNGRLLSIVRWKPVFALFDQALISIPDAVLMLGLDPHARQPEDLWLSVPFVSISLANGTDLFQEQFGHCSGAARCDSFLRHFTIRSLDFLARTEDASRITAAGHAEVEVSGMVDTCLGLDASAEYQKESNQVSLLWTAATTNIVFSKLASILGPRLSLEAEARKQPDGVTKLESLIFNLWAQSCQLGHLRFEGCNLSTHAFGCGDADQKDFFITFKQDDLPVFLQSLASKAKALGPIGLIGELFVARVGLGSGLSASGLRLELEIPGGSGMGVGAVDHDGRLLALARIFLDEARLHRLALTQQHCALYLSADRLSFAYDGGLAEGKILLRGFVHRESDGPQSAAFTGRLELEPVQVEGLFPLSQLAAQLPDLDWKGRIKVSTDLSVGNKAERLTARARAECTFERIFLSTYNTKLFDLEGVISAIFEDGQLSLSATNLHIAKLQTGDVVISNVAVAASLENGVIGLDIRRGELLGGSMAGSSLSLDLQGRIIGGTLRLEKLDLSQLAALVPKSLLQAEGRIGGLVTVFFRDGRWDLPLGFLELAKGQKAMISYLGEGWLTQGISPSDPRYQTLSLVEQALKRLEVTLMSIEIRADDPSQPVVRIRLEGRSQNEKIIVPVMLELRIHGDLRDVLSYLQWLQTAKSFKASVR